jgi:hypothetical protein
MTTTTINTATRPAALSPELQAINDSLKNEQPAALNAAMRWLEQPADPMRTDTCVAVITGYAGTGKSFITQAIIKNVIERLGLSGEEDILGLAPTHAAVKNLSDFARVPARTIHSFLGLRMASVKLTKDQRKELDRLHAASSSLDFSPADVARLALLESLEQAEAERRKEMRPMLAPADFAESCKAKLVVIDEGYMMDKVLCGLVLEMLVFNMSLEYQPKILILGDPAQLAPIGEQLSMVAEFRHIGHLTTVVRQQGVQLDYVTAVRNCEDEAELGYLHQQYLAENDPSLVRLSQPIIEQHFRAQAEEVGLENIRVLTTSNARVRELNEILYRCTYPELPYDRPYANAHRLLTLGPIMRDPNFPDKPGASEGQILFPTSTVVNVERALTSRKVTSPAGSEYTISTLFVSAGAIEHEIVAPHPLEIGQWEDEKNLFYKMAAATTGRSKKPGARGQEGDYAKRAWEVFGLKNWQQAKAEEDFQTEAERDRVLEIWARWAESRTRSRVLLKMGQRLDTSDFKCVKGMLWQEYHRVRQLADNVSPAFCSTVHRSQGQTIKLVILDFPKFMPRSGGYVKPDSTWDSKKTLYTAASRVGGEGSQLIFMY